MIWQDFAIVGLLFLAVFLMAVILRQDGEL
jgi:hypothetical protein